MTGGSRRNPVPQGKGVPFLPGGGKGPGYSDSENEATAAARQAGKASATPDHDLVRTHLDAAPEAAKPYLDAALANAEGKDGRRLRKELATAHADAHEAGNLNPESDAAFGKVMESLGVKPIGEVGATVPFDAATMESAAGISSGTPVKVTRRGWSGLYGDAATGHENIGNNVRRAMVEPVGASATVGRSLEAKPVSATKPARTAKPAPALNVDHPAVREKFGGAAKPSEPTAATAVPAADTTAELAALERIPFGKHTKEQRNRLAELRAKAGGTTPPNAPAGSSPTPARTTPADPAGFGAAARAAADAHDTGFGRAKVFIGDVYDKLAAADPGLTRAEFDRRLLAAHQAGHVDLTRADLVQLMHPDDVARSKVQHPMLTGSSGELHFIGAAARDRKPIRGPA